MFLCSFIVTASQPWQSPDGRITYFPAPDNTGVVMGIIVVLVIFVAGAFLGLYFISKRTQDSHDKELEKLDRQFREGVISEENYIGMKQDVDRKYSSLGLSKPKHQYVPSITKPVSSPSISYCPKCGNELTNEDFFCNKCGTKKK